MDRNKRIYSALAQLCARVDNMPLLTMRRKRMLTEIGITRVSEIYDRSALFLKKRHWKMLILQLQESLRAMNLPDDLAAFTKSSDVRDYVVFQAGLEAGEEQAEIRLSEQDVTWSGVLSEQHMRFAGTIAFITDAAKQYVIDEVRESERAVAAARMRTWRISHFGYAGSGRFGWLRRELLRLQGLGALFVQFEVIYEDLELPGSHHLAKIDIDIRPLATALYQALAQKVPSPKGEKRDRCVALKSVSLLIFENRYIGDIEFSLRDGLRLVRFDPATKAVSEQ